MLIKCPECGREISDQAQACPNCGVGINKQPQSPQQIPIQQMPPTYQPPPPPKKPMSGCLVFIIVIAAVFTGILVIGGIASIFTPSKEVEPTSESVALDESQQEYLPFILVQTRALGNGLTTLSEQIKIIEEDPSKRFEVFWRIDMLECIDRINVSADAIIEYDATQVPDEFIDIHNSLVSSAQSYRAAMEIIADGVDGGDMERINMATEYLESGANYMDLATEKMKDATT